MRASVVACVLCVAACSSVGDGVDGGASDMAVEPDATAMDDASAPDAGDGGDGLTDDERAFVDAYARAFCTGVYCDARGLEPLHGNIDACERMLGWIFTDTLADAIATDVVELDPAHEAECLAELATCPSVARPLDDACSRALLRHQARETGDPCSVDAECAVLEQCGSQGIVVGRFCLQRRCVVPAPLGGDCRSVPCARDDLGPVECLADVCVRRRDTVVADGEVCDWTTIDPDGTHVFASCPPEDACLSDGAGHFACMPRRTEGQPCISSECAASLTCGLGGLCVPFHYVGLGATGCASEPATLCDGALDLFCDFATDTCVAAGDGSEGTTCNEGNGFYCDHALACIDGTCVARLPVGAACTVPGDLDTPCDGTCGTDGTCQACP